MNVNAPLLCCQPVMMMGSGSKRPQMQQLSGGDAAVVVRDEETLKILAACVYIPPLHACNVYACVCPCVHSTVARMSAHFLFLI